MKRALRIMMVVGCSLVFGMAAHAAPASTYTFVCNGKTHLNLTLSSFSLGFSETSANTAGVGRKANYAGSLRLLAGTNYADLQRFVMSSELFVVCKLTETTGTFIQEWGLNDVVMTSVTALGSDGSNAASGGANVPTGFTQVTFTVASVTYTARP